jgi:hypothetical protein
LLGFNINGLPSSVQARSFRLDAEEPPSELVLIKEVLGNLVDSGVLTFVETIFSRENICKLY